MAVVPAVLADTLVLQNGNRVSGTILQTNQEKILLLTEDAAFCFQRQDLKEIKVEPSVFEPRSTTNRLLNFQDTLVRLSRQPWAANLAPIPATVIDKGNLRNIPYSSFRCGEDYEVNVYGDLEHPVCIEIGVYRKLTGDSSAKNNCVNFIRDILNRPTDKAVVEKLNLKTDYKTVDDLTFEITPPSDVDAYGGWWISIYLEDEFFKARATEAEMREISFAKAEKTEPVSKSGWSNNDLKQARALPPTTISFTSPEGTVVTNAKVINVIDGVSLIWSEDTTNWRVAKSGMVKLADLPEPLRKRFGYDAGKTKAADDLARAKLERWREQAVATAAPPSQYNQPAWPYFYSGYADSYSSADSGGGQIYVHGYYRNGTYVNSYTRSSPHRQ